MLFQLTSTRVVSLLRTDYLAEFLFSTVDGWQRFDGSHSELLTRMRPGDTVMIGRLEPTRQVYVLDDVLVEDAKVTSDGGYFTVDSKRHRLVWPLRLPIRPKEDDWWILTLFRPVPQQ